jgi:hypothetical protein
MVQRVVIIFQSVVIIFQSVVIIVQSVVIKKQISMRFEPQPHSSNKLKYPA